LGLLPDIGPPRTHPLITQEALAATHTDKLKLSFLLFDEIEKASDALWQLLLACWTRPPLRWATSPSRPVTNSDFHDLEPGGAEIMELMQGALVFVQPKDKPATGLDEKVERAA